MNSKWYDFYSQRVNSTYQDYFEKRYRGMLDFIRSFQPSGIIEAGCGIGSISKALIKSGLRCSGFDNDPQMVKLANKNVPSIIPLFEVLDIFKCGLNNTTLTITHGVLEHFDDGDIILFKNRFPNSIHYVPLDKYHEPSFGDERLLSKDYWIDTFKPAYHFTINNEHDLIFKF